MHTKGSIMRRRGGIALLTLAASGCAGPDCSTRGLPARLDAVVANHPGALNDAPDAAADLVDDLRQTWRAWAGEGAD